MYGLRTDLWETLWHTVTHFYTMWQTNEWPKENSDYLVLCEFIFRSISSWVKFSISRSDRSSKFPLWPHNSKMLNSKQAVGIPKDKVKQNQSKG